MIEKVTDENFNEVIPLIEEYQKFYGVDNIDKDKNKLYFRRFVDSNENGVLHILKINNQTIGFTTIYKCFSSTRAEEVAVLSDLYVSPFHRGKGFGKKLINHAIDTVKLLGYSRLQWLTAQDNEVAQKLYSSLSTNKSSWFFYTKKT